MARAQLVLPVSPNGSVSSGDNLQADEFEAVPAPAGAGLDDLAGPEVAQAGGQGTMDCRPTAPAQGVVPGWVGVLTVLSVVLVAGAAAVASVGHLADVARLAGTDGWRVWLLPAAVDGLATAAALGLYRAHRLGVSAGLVAWVSLLAGIGASVAGNVVAVYPALVDLGPLKVAVGATPPLSLALVVHVALRQAQPAVVGPLAVGGGAGG